MRAIFGATGLAITLATAIGYGQGLSSTAAAPDTLALALADTATLWFVELASPPTIEGTAAATLEREESSFHAAAAAAGVRYSESRHFRDLWNGLTVRATTTRSRRSGRSPTSALSIRSGPSALHSRKVRRRSPPT
jgi:hypothetical protein